MADLKNIKGISDADKKLLEQAEEWLGTEPAKMGPAKNFFWGNVKEEFYFPYPQVDAREEAECDQLLARLDEYLRKEHPAIQIDQDQEIPRWVVDRLFQLGVLGMTIPKEYGGLGMGITSYNRVLERIGNSCGSTAVLVSAHQSIGCKAVMLFGSPEQKKQWLPHLAKDWLSAFCLSEPNVGCDAGGQETEFVKDGDYYIVTGEKKWATSGAISGLFTVMAREKRADGKGKISALVMHPWQEGVEIYQKNRSKCGIRGTWQARIRFHGVRVHKDHLLGQEGRGLQIALSCLNYGRCTLSAGMLGGARKTMDQSIKWSDTRFQFDKALNDKELVRKRIANMAALCYAMDATLYMTTGMLDRHDEDIQVETALCKVFASEMGWRAVNDAVQMRRFERRNIGPEVVQEVQTPVRVQNKGLTRIDPTTGRIADSTDDHRMVSFALPAAITVMMLIVVMLASMPAMQSIVEEKQQRIAEVLLGCVSPFELMLGKLLGVVAVSLTISGFYLAGSYFVVSRLGASNLVTNGLMVWFVLFLLLAVMVYGSLFMAVGAAAGDMKETQSLQMPVTMMIILPTLLLGTLLREPNGKVAVIGSFVPFSAPMLMMARLSTGAQVPTWQPALAATGVLLTALACVWASGRVFRVGLLLQGKGVRFADLLRWVLRG